MSELKRNIRILNKDIDLKKWISLGLSHERRYQT